MVASRSFKVNVVIASLSFYSFNWQ